MVRLKVENETSESAYFNKFQFLMVRLKEPFFLIKNYLTKISIPYGAIKSPFHLFVVLLYEFISIPYGAIKRI